MFKKNQFMVIMGLSFDLERSNIMNTEWNLDVFYKGYDDPEFKKDFEECAKQADKLQKAVDLAKTLDNVKGLRAVIDAEEEYVKLVMKVGEYISLRSSVNTTDSDTNNNQAKFGRIMSEAAKPFATIDKYIAGIENLDECLEKDEVLKEYSFMLHNIKENASHQFSDDMEAMISKMNLSGGAAWGKLFDYLTSTVKVDYSGKEITLPEVRNLATNSDKDVRKKGYEAELACYDKIAGPIAFALNNIKSQVNMLSRERGYESALDMTLHQTHMKRETLDAMFAAMNEYFPKFHEYLKAKAHYLGYE